MKRFIGLILTLSILFGCCINSSAVSVADNNNMSQVKIASREEIFGRASRAAAMPSSESDKLEYVETVFEYMGFDKKFIGLLSDDLIDEMLKAEEFGFSTNAVNSAPQRASSQTESGSNSAIRKDKIYLSILWIRYDNLYTVIGGYNWLKSPAMKLTDVISIDINGSFVNDSPGLLFQYTVDGVEKEYTYDYTSDEYIGEGTSCIFKIDLPWNADQGSISALVSYQVTNNDRYNTIYSQYFHYYLPTPIAFSVNYILGISIESAGVTEYKLQCGTAQEG